MQKRTILFATRLVAARKLDRKDRRKFRKLFRENAKNEDGDRFQDVLLAGLVTQMEASGEAEAVWATDGTVEAVEAAWLDSLTEIIDWLLDNWDSLAKLILFIIGLF